MPSKRTTACALLCALVLCGCASQQHAQPDPLVLPICPAPPPPPAWTLKPPSSLLLLDKLFSISAPP